MSDVAGLLLAIATAVAAGLIGCFAVMRRMALAADAISHVALPGIGVAVALGIHPLFGALAMLFFGGLLIWSLERRTRIPTETIIGVVFSAALAVGSLMSSGEDLIDALLGQRGSLGTGEIAFGLGAAVAVTGFVLTYRSKLILWLVSPEIAKTSGIDVVRLNLLFLEVLALAVALGLRYLGVLLMGSLVIIPAATAKRLARTLTQMLAYAVGVAVASTLAGTLIADRVGRPSAPVIVATAAALFLASLLRRGT
jgi:ABC-type Mn2+/Zn2+ transport system permease subunit